MAIIPTAVDDGAMSTLSLASAGDEAAFARIVATHHARMTKVAYLVCGDLNLADEAVASAWPHAWQKLRTLRDPARLGPWLVSVAANEARQLVRRKRRRSITEVAVGGDEFDPASDPGLRSRDLDLVNALSRLSPDDRALLALRYVAGLNATELGRATGRSASGTRARLARLLGRLRSELSDD